MNVSRRRIAVRIVLSALLISASSGVSFATSLDSQARASGDLSGSDACVPLTEFSVSYMDESGKAVTADTEAATVIHYQIQPGDDIEQIYPPTNFNPMTADVAWLNLLGFDPRPTDPDGLQLWASTYANWKPSSPGSSTPCRTDRSHTILNSDHWSGIMDNGYTDYRRAYGSARVPTFSASCTTASDLALWVGLGGWGEPNLIQNGVDARQSSLQGMDSWWEMMNTNYDSNSVTEDSNFASAGNLVKADTYYNSAYDRVQFNWFNLTTGHQTTVWVTSVGTGFSPSEFYSGKTAEWIDERSAHSGGGLYNLRNYGTAGWTDAYVARAGQPATAAGSVPHVGIDMVGSGPVQPISELVGDHMVTAINWNMHWRGCN
jgi:hypothetical protein